MLLEIEMFEFFPKEVIRSTLERGLQYLVTSKPIGRNGILKPM
jgi:hypothetical protein